jgi:hypothetical protein
MLFSSTQGDSEKGGLVDVDYSVADLRHGSCEASVGTASLAVLLMFPHMMAEGPPLSPTSSSSVSSSRRLTPQKNPIQ